MKKTTLMIIEDEKAIRDLLRFTFHDSAYQLLEAESTQQASQLLGDNIPDLIILDWMLPGKSGIDFLKWLRQHNLYKDIPIIMLTARAEEENKIKGLTCGADDYVTKPFSPEELKARAKSILRRGPLIQSVEGMSVANLQLDPNTHSVSHHHHKINLSPIEYKMLYFFMSHPGKVYTREHLIAHIWDINTDMTDRTIDVSIRRLRNKLKPFNCDQFIKTIRGAGYLFEKTNP